LREGEHLVHACQTTIDWLVHTQRGDGSWGFFDRGTQEETAYALTALIHYARTHDLPAEPIHRGATYLAQAHEGNRPYPPLWIVKCLYMPHDIVRSAILAALVLYEQTFGRSI